jgi:hypothetical protein
MKPPTATRHPDLMTTEEAAAYMGVARLDQLPERFRPRPIAYRTGIYHRHTLDSIIAEAATTTDGKRKLELA